MDDIITVRNLKLRFDDEWIHDGINLNVQRGEILAVVGGSGAGKTTLLREMLLLEPPTEGSIKIFDQEVTQAAPKQLVAVQQRWGVLFQQSALFSSLTLLENVVFPLQEHTKLDRATCNELAMLKILSVGLPADAAAKYPVELSGGMQKRAALARAIVLDPELLFLDEPTSGLDPDSAAAFDKLIVNLQSALGLTIVMVTHDLDSLWQISNRVAFLGEKKVLAVAPVRELVNNPHPLIQEYFSGARGRTVQSIYRD